MQNNKKIKKPAGEIKQSNFQTKQLLENVLVISDSDISVTSVTDTNFKLVAKPRQRPTPLCAVSTKRTATTPTVMLQRTHTVFYPYTWWAQLVPSQK